MPTVLITGASRGIGLELARQYAADGWRVIATCRDSAGEQSLREVAGDLAVERLEVTDWDAIPALAGRLGGRPIDLLLNNAGIAGRAAGDLGSLDPRVWEETFRVNVIAPILTAQALADNVAASGQRTMAFISTMLGSLTLNEQGGRYAYRSSKAALNMACRSLAADLAPRGIGVLMLHPGHVRTDMGGPTAPVTPEASVTGMRQVIAGFTAAQTGQFINYDGRPIPW